MSTSNQLIRLTRGDRIGVVACSFALRPASLRSGIAALERMGFDVARGRHLLEQDGYFAGSDAARLDDLNAMLRDDTIEAIWFARGGYGAARLLRGVDWRAARRRPKAWIGYSDVTALFAAATRRDAAVCIHGPMVAELGQPRAYDRSSLRRALGAQRQSWPLRKRQVLVAGRAVGPLQGGNLSVLTHLLGTRWRPRLDGAVLFIEDVDEPLYAIDRQLLQWTQSGALDGVAAVIVGDLRPRLRSRFPPDRQLRDVLDEAFIPLGVPVIGGLPLGHCPRKRSVRLGARVEVDTRRLRVVFG